MNRAFALFATIITLGGAELPPLCAQAAELSAPPAGLQIHCERHDYSSGWVVTATAPTPEGPASKLTVYRYWIKPPLIGHTYDYDAILKNDGAVADFVTTDFELRVNLERQYAELLFEYEGKKADVGMGCKLSSSNKEARRR